MIRITIEVLIHLGVALDRASDAVLAAVDRLHHWDLGRRTRDSRS